ncbi:MAG: sugar phosphate isomerase/epimerase family protein [Spirochaetota bacterium]
MRFGVADYGISVWDGGNFDFEARMAALKDIGFDGIERISAATEADLLQKAAAARRLGGGFATVRGPSDDLSIRWAAALGCDYVWISNKPTDFDRPTFFRQSRAFASACAKYGLKAGLHNHMGTCIETQPQLEEFLKECPECTIIFDTAHLAAMGGDPAHIIRSYPDRIQVMHMKDWIMKDPDHEVWHQRGRFCELGAGNIGMDHEDIMKALSEAKFEGWVFIEQDKHEQDPLIDLEASLKLLQGYRA